MFLHFFDIILKTDGFCLILRNQITRPMGGGEVTCENANCASHSELLHFRITGLKSTKAIRNLLKRCLELHLLLTVYKKKKRGKRKVFKNILKIFEV